MHTHPSAKQVMEKIAASEDFKDDDDDDEVIGPPLHYMVS